MMTPFGNHPTLNDNLLRYFNCNDNYADNVVRDACHNGDGTLIADTSADFSEAGKINKCFNYGTVNKGFSAAIESYPGEYFELGKPFSINIWFYYTAPTGSYKTLFGNVDSSLVGFYFTLDPTEASYGIHFALRNGGIYQIIRSSPFPSSYINTWVMITATYDGNSINPYHGMNIYYNSINSTFAAVSAGSLTSFAQSDDVLFGSTTYTSFNNFDGKQSDAGAWSKDLSVTEISALFNMSHGRARDPVKSNFFENHSTLAANCLAEWGLEDDAASTDVAEVTDRFGGVCTTNTEDLSVSGGLFGGNLFDFSLSASKHVAIHEIAPYVGWGKKFSVEIWFYGNAITRRLFGSNYSTTATAYTFYIYNSVIYCIASSATSAGYEQLTKSITLLSGWNQLIHTYDGNSNIKGFGSGSEIYFNGVSISPTSTYVGNQVDFTPSTMHIGSIGSLSYDNDKLSLTRFFTKELSQDEVTYLNNNQLGRKSL